MSSKKYGRQFIKGLSQYRVPSEVTSLVIEEFYRSLDCPRSLAAWLMWKHNEHEQLANLGFSPSDYDSVSRARDAYAATKFLSKFTGFNLEQDLDAAAFHKFREFENLCKATNDRFRNLSLDPLYRDEVVWLHHAVIRKIDRILGDFSAEEFFDWPDWGPGASTLVKRRDASSVNKFQCETGITRDLHGLISTDVLQGAYPLWARHLIEMGFPTYQIGNKVVTVPKDATTNRVIAIEPGINLWFQKSAGDMIGTRLLRWGVDLRLQNVNQRLAQEGSRTNLLATVDLTSASDSIASSVVEALLPPRWFTLLNACRSPYGRLKDEQLKWEKFSSMGNGFTFQLESLIFYAVALCCTEFLGLDERYVKTVNSYGDDVILPSAAFSLFSRMLRFYGFRINLKKSYSDSAFRESCGAHYYLGCDVKPIYLRDRLLSVPAVFRLANAVRRMSHRRNSFFGCDVTFKPLFDLLVALVPKALRLRIPETLGDGGFVSNLDEATPSLARHGFEGFRVPNLAEVSLTYQDDRVGYLLANLWGLSHQPDSPLRDYWVDHGHTKLQAIRGLSFESPSLARNSVPRKMALRFKVTNSLVSRWYNLGPWL